MLQQLLAKPEYEGWDGELAILGSAKLINPNCYRETVSTVMSEKLNASDVYWYVFDNMTSYQLPYITRYNSINAFRWDHTQVYNEIDLLEAEQEALSFGYEGLILRDPSAPYKFGRSTLKEGWMLKLKRFQDDEATVIDFDELEHNANPAQLDERGYTKHSHHQENKVPMNTLGALITIWQGQVLKIGTGFNRADREYIWANKDKFKGAIVKFKYLNTGMKDLPRHPVFLQWRHKLDVGT